MWVGGRWILGSIFEEELFQTLPGVAETRSLLCFCPLSGAVKYNILYKANVIDEAPRCASLLSKASLTLAIMGHVGSAEAVCPVLYMNAPARAAPCHPSPADQQQPPCSSPGDWALLGTSLGAIQSTLLRCFTLDLQEGFSGKQSTKRRAGNTLASVFSRCP